MQQGDLDGARRLGRLARMLSISFIIVGIIIIIVAVTVNIAGEAQLARCEDGQGCSLGPWGRGGGGKGRAHGGYSLSSVSYTHLTLPTTVGPCRSRWSPYH